LRQADLPRVVSALERPIHDFIRESRVRIALLINSAGQVLAQHGFTRSYEVMNVASLAAAAHASARALAQMSEAARWTHMHHAGKERQLFLAPIRTPVVELILVAIFDKDTSLGIVQLFFDRFGKTIAELPELKERMEATTQHTFEGDLQAGLRVIVEPPKGKA
jgi:hypothetical protein